MTERLFFLACVCVLFAGIAGCNRESEGISAYEVPKDKTVYDENHVEKAKPRHQVGDDNPEVPRSRPAPRQRMLAAMVLHGRKFWFFKLQGLDADVNAASGKFVAFIRTVDFSEGKPTWKLPNGWKQLPDDDGRNLGGFFPRFATILVDPNDEDLELTVTSLVNRAADDAETKQFILQNVNRWRVQQMGLKPRTPANLYDKPATTDPKNVDEVQETSINGHRTILVQCVGRPKPRRPGQGPFMGGPRIPTH